jgi:3-deoxy-D-manno-octulosonic acid (KDO) 8-phosphate synthase
MHRQSAGVTDGARASCGYNNLVADMCSVAILRTFGYPVVFDATHSVQLPGGAGQASSGQREFVPALARAAVGVRIDGLSTDLPALLAQGQAINAIVQRATGTSL